MDCRHLLVLLFISFIKEWMPVEITALTGTAVLMLTGILSTRDVLSSFLPTADR